MVPPAAVKLGAGGATAPTGSSPSVASPAKALLGGAAAAAAAATPAPAPASFAADSGASAAALAEAKAQLEATKKQLQVVVGGAFHACGRGFLVIGGPVFACGGCHLSV